MILKWQSEWIIQLLVMVTLKVMANMSTEKPQEAERKLRSAILKSRREGNRSKSARDC